MFRTYRTGLVLCGVLLAASRRASPQRSLSPAAFSSMESIEQTGDVVGTEVLVLRTSNGACVSYQLAEGAAEPLRIVRAELRGDSLVFRIPPDSAYRGGTHELEEIGPALWFRGRLTTRGLRAQIEGYAEAIWLPRRRHPYFSASARQLSNAVRRMNCQ